MRINFLCVRWKNFLATGNQFTEIDLTKSSTTLIVGKNGMGKSTFTDALTFALYGKAYRKINKPLLVNSVNNSNCVAEVEFKIGKKHYKITRGIKPTIFDIHINGKLVDQDAKSKDYQEYLEKNILHMSYKVFTQVVMLGSNNYTPFMQLNALDRRTVIEDLLDIKIFSQMTSVTKSKISTNKEKTITIKNSIEFIKEKIKFQEDVIKENTDNTKLKIEELDKEIEEHLKELEILTKDYDSLQVEIKDLQNKVKDRNILDEKIRQLTQFEAKLDQNIEKTKEEINFFTHNDNCPVCKQLIDEGFKKEKQKEFKEKHKKYEKGIIDIKNKTEITKKEISIIDEFLQKISKKQKKSFEITVNIQTLHKYIKKIESEKELLTTNKTSVEKEQFKLNDFINQLTDLEKNYIETIEEKSFLEVAQTLLKDNGIKANIIKQYLPIINKSINDYLKMMDFYVNFTLDENFNEKILSRYRDEFSYGNFSEGEKLRIDLALLFTWRVIGKKKNSIETNILIFDELLDGSLDNEGTENFLKLIQTMHENVHIFIISHKKEQLENKFDRVIRFVKENNFSVVK